MAFKKKKLLLSAAANSQLSIVIKTVRVWSQKYVQARQDCFELMDWNMPCGAHTERMQGSPAAQHVIFHVDPSIPLNSLLFFCGSI